MAAPPKDRRAFIAAYLTDHVAVDILDRDFVEAYGDATGATLELQPYGAPRCKMLGRDLSSMYRAGQLERAVVGTHGAEAGSPNWVYSYSLAAASARPAAGAPDHGM